MAAFEGIRFRLTAMRARISVGQAHFDACVLAHTTGLLAADEPAEAKPVATELQGEALDDCRQMFGGYGYLREHPVRRRCADAVLQRISGDTSEIMKEINSRSMDL